jgi:hypothetical protein
MNFFDHRGLQQIRGARLRKKLTQFAQRHLHDFRP